ncbi:MAG: FtsX-like permease family protein [Chitinophagaceae bacterium]|nr:FtsX-like permease family protein [Chitinophagaceae bacterium]
MKQKILWLFQLAIRDSRGSRVRLLLFSSATLLGIASLSAINSFRESVSISINRQAKSVLGADLVISSTKKPSAEIQSFLDSIGRKKSQECSFASMIYFVKNGDSRLVQVRALEGGFPYYGALETEPTSASLSFRNKKEALVDATVMLQFEMQIGDTIKIGKEFFTIAGRLKKTPGQTGITASVSPVVYIPYSYLETTGLVIRGSRVNYFTYYQFVDGDASLSIKKKWKQRFSQLDLRATTWADSQQDSNESLKELSKFLNMIAFIALLLGCLGVGSSVYVYMKEKINTLSILRCIGASSTDIMWVFLLQIVGIGLISSFLGALLGICLQMLIPLLISNFLPIDVPFFFSVKVFFQSLLLGVLISILFSILPILRAKNISPIESLKSVEYKNLPSLKGAYWVYIIIALSLFLLTLWQVESITKSIFFCLGLLVITAALFLIASASMFLIRKYFPHQFPYIWRQGLANMFRPQNQTMVLVFSIGLGTALIATIFITQASLTHQFHITPQKDRPNMILFDIQTSQKDTIASITRSHKLPVIQQVPIVNMRLLKVRNISKKQREQDSTIQIPLSAFNREYRVTYRDTLIDSEKIIKGKPHFMKNDSIFISVADFYAEDLDIQLGDEILFDLQGIPLKTYVKNIRKINWNRMQTNFLIVFPTGILETAPQFHVLLTQVNDEQASATYQRTIIQAFPNISIVDIKLLITTIEGILTKVKFVLQCMSLISIITGIIVLIISINNTKFQRLKETVLLRTIGATKKQIVSITAIEYFLLGTISTFSGILLAILSSYTLIYFIFESEFILDYIALINIFLGIVGITVFLGVYNNRKILLQSPLESLRNA